jgi:hypothetical protein
VTDFCVGPRPGIQPIDTVQLEEFLLEQRITPEDGRQFHIGNWSNCQPLYLMRFKAICGTQVKVRSFNRMSSKTHESTTHAINLPRLPQHFHPFIRAPRFETMFRGEVQRSDRVRLNLRR